MAKHQFQTEVNQLLHLIVHSLYSHKEIFLRELVSNSSDALDKLKYLTLTDKDYKKLDFEPRVDIEFDEEKKKTLTISDTGIGMNAEELEENLGTIARSGTKNFMGSLTGDAKKDSNLIGQFGVGFYSSFMVADKVEVISRKAGEDKAFRWVSDGKGEYDVTETERESFGTTVVVHLNDEGKEYANRWQIEQVVKKYSNHVAFPIYLHYDKVSYEGEDNKDKKVEPVVDQINSASALWRRSKSELSDEDYMDFYKSLSHDSDDPMFHLHVKAEGTQEYTTLFYVPKKAPFDLFQADYQPGVKLYVRRVFIMDDSKELLPTYLRFVRGIIDSEDLPLNVSREILQQNRNLRAITTASVKKILGEFKSVAEGNKELYAEFVEQYNRPLKEGLYSDFANRETLLELVRYHSTEAEGFTSLAEYKERMKDDQKAIYYVTGGDLATLKNSPLLEAYKKKGIEVLLMGDEIDEIVVPSVGKYGDFDLKAVNRADAMDDLKGEDDKEREEAVKPLIEKIAEALGDRVKKVVASTRLSDSPSCIVADENDPSMQMQQMLKAMGQAEVPEIIPILEVNPDHEIVKKLEGRTEDAEMVADVSFLLLDQAMMLEGAPVKSPADFVARLNRVMEAAL